MAIKGDVTGLDVLMFGQKPLVPLNSGFSRTRDSGVARSSSPGGASRLRKKYYGTTHLVNATFYLDSPAKQDFIQRFINRNEGKRFICHLAADRPIVEPYVVQAVSEWSHDDVSAIYGNVTVQLEVYSTSEPCLDEWFYNMYQCYGDDLCREVNLLNDLATGWPTP